MFKRIGVVLSELPMALLCLMLMTGIIPAQQVGGYKFEKVTLTSGQGALSSGLDATMLMKSGNRELELVLEKDLQWAVWDFNITPKIQVSPSAGYFYGTPWIGPRFALKPLPHLTLMNWTTVSMGKPEKPNWHAEFLNNFAGAYLGGFGPVSVGWGMLHFQNQKPQHMPGATFSRDLGDGYSAMTGLDYNITKNKPLYRIGVSWNPAKTAQTTPVVAEAKK